jgi:predicted dehydrogenase
VTGATASAGGDPPAHVAPVRLAVVGVGHLGRHHARVAAELPGISLVGIHDHHEGRAEEVARERGLRVLSGPEEVAEAAEAVVVATPTSSHGELGRFFLERGLDVLVEKPLTPAVEEASALVDLARARSRVLAVGHVERFNPAVQALLAQTEPPLFIEGLRLAPFTPRSLDIDVVLDLMIHDLQIVADLVRRPIREIRAVGMPVVTSRIDIANARLEFEGGCVATLTASRVSAERMRKLRVFGPSLYCSVDMHARTIRARRLLDGSGRPDIVPVEVPVETGDPLARELEDFAGAVRERREPLVPGEVGRDALVLAHRVLAAIAEHRSATGARA